MVRGQSGRAMVLGVLAALVVALAAGSAGATSYTWQGKYSNIWNEEGGPGTGSGNKNWNPTGVPNSYSDQATINNSTKNPVLIGSGLFIKLGGQISTELPYALYIGSDAGATALTISGTLGMQGNISNAKTIVISGTLRNDATSKTTEYTISGSGKISLQGGTISSGIPGSSTIVGGIWVFNQNVEGYGTISAQVTNNATVTLSGSSSISNTFTNNKTVNLSGTPTISGAFTNNSGGTLNVTGGTTTISGNFTNQGTVSAASGTTVTVTGTASKLGSFTSSGGTQSFGTLKVEQYGYLVGGTGTFTVSGDFLNYSTQNSQWDTGSATLAFTSGSHQMAVAGLDMGQSMSGYDYNYAWGTLSIAAGGSLSLQDSFPGDNKNAALYVGVITGVVINANGMVTNITGNGINIYYDPSLSNNAYLEGKKYALQNGGYLSPVPLPGSVWLLGSGLVGLLLVCRRWRRRI